MLLYIKARRDLGLQLSRQNIAHPICRQTTVTCMSLRHLDEFRNRIDNRFRARVHFGNELLHFGT